MYTDDANPLARTGDDARVVDFGTFEADLTADDWIAKHRAGELGGVGPIFMPPFEVLTPANTVGLGRTNLTLVRPTVVQTDAATPHASFDRRESPNRNPAVSVHFNPGAYGVTWTGTYVFSFLVEATVRAAWSADGVRRVGHRRRTRFDPLQRTACHHGDPAQRAPDPGHVRGHRADLR